MSDDGVPPVDGTEVPLTASRCCADYRRWPAALASAWCVALVSMFVSCVSPPGGSEGFGVPMFPRRVGDCEVGLYYSPIKLDVDFEVKNESQNPFVFVWTEPILVSPPRKSGSIDTFTRYSQNLRFYNVELDKLPVMWTRALEPGATLRFVSTYYEPAPCFQVEFGIARDLDVIDQARLLSVNNTDKYRWTFDWIVEKTQIWKATINIGSQPP